MKQPVRLIVIAAAVVLLLAFIAWATLWRASSGQIQSNDPLYLISTPKGQTQVWSLDWKTYDTQQITLLPGDVLEAAPVPHTSGVTYPVERSEGGHDLWWVDVQRQRARLWLNCAPDDCTAIAWSPDGEKAVYTRKATGDPELWQVARDSGDTAPLFEEDPTPGDHASWSPDGMYVAYVVNTGKVCAVNIADKEDARCIPSLSEFPPVWAPDGSALLITDIRLEAKYASHILSIDMATGDYRDLSVGLGVEDDTPVWSPDGAWIAFRRRPSGSAIGKQVWRMHPDGSDAQVLSENSNTYYGTPIWRDDGALLLVAGFDSGGNGGLWAISPEDVSITLLVPGGYLPHR